MKKQQRGRRYRIRTRLIHGNRERHGEWQKCANKVAQFLEQHPKVAWVHYPGLETFPQHELARRRMTSYDGKFAPEAWSIFAQG